MSAIADLLVLGEQGNFGGTFLPGSKGWTVGYLRGMAGGDLSTANDLHTAAVAAFRPLIELINRREENRQ